MSDSQIDVKIPSMAKVFRSVQEYEGLMPRKRVNNNTTRAASNCRVFTVS
jgi:hypothetical protein